MLRAADVRFAYRPETPILDGVSLDVPEGSFTGILGPNGSGKSTLLRLLAGTLRPQHGEITIDGIRIASLSRSQLARRMAVVPQETWLAFEYSVLEVVLMGRYPHLRAFEIEGPADVDIAREALAATGTLAFEGRPFGTLSGGEKQRVIIAAALAQLGAASDAPDAPALLPSFLLLDEPTAALDLGYQLETAAILRGLQERMAVTVVMCTHDLNFAASLCRHLVLLRSGRVIAAGPPDSALTPDTIRELYAVHADVRWHTAAGHLVVTPIGRAG